MKAGQPSAPFKTEATVTLEDRNNGIKASYTTQEWSIYTTHHNLHTEINAGQIYTKYITRQMNGCSSLPASLFAHSISI